MNKNRKALGWVFVIVAIVVLALLIYSAGDASGSDINDCYPGEHCYVVWPPWESEHCNGGIYTLWFCYLPKDPYNGDFWHYHATCDSSIVPPLVFRVVLPLIYGAYNG